VQIPLVDELEYNPAGQAEQLEEPAIEVVPALQTTQTLVPLSYVPAEH
jgi:hypothetical protein